MDANVTPLQQAAADAPPWAAPSPPDVPVPTPLAELIHDYVAQLLVDEGTHGRRSVHIELKDDTLTGVSLAVSENAGTLVSVFSCTNDTAFQKLGANADELARSLADALGRCTRVEVRRDDLQETRLIEASAQASR